jgi:hypothetical protein
MIKRIAGGVGLFTIAHFGQGLWIAAMKNRSLRGRLIRTFPNE